MQKAILYILFLLSFIHVLGQDVLVTGKHNKIDEIKSAKQALKFIREVNPDFKDYNIYPKPKYDSGECIRCSDSLGVQSWVKADFDSNGYTDLLCIINREGINRLICILDSGDNHFYSTYVILYMSRYLFPLVKEINGKSVIILKYCNLINSDRIHWTGDITDTFYCTPGGFVNTSIKRQYKYIESIEYVYSGFPRSRLRDARVVIDKDLKMDCNLIYGDTIINLKCPITKREFREMEVLVNNIHISKESGRRFLRHESKVDFKIKYTNGETIDAQYFVGSRALSEVDILIDAIVEAAARRNIALRK